MDVGSRLSVGVEYNPKADNVELLANLRVVDETARRPAVRVGTSSDRVGTPSGESYFVTVAKDLEGLTGLPLAPYVGVAYGTYEDKARPIGGLNVRLGARWSSLMMFDGVHLHQTLTYINGRHGLTLVLIRSKHPGISYNVRF